MAAVWNHGDEGSIEEENKKQKRSRKKRKGAYKNHSLMAEYERGSVGDQ
jgi:hypothetical protein